MYISFLLLNNYFNNFSKYLIKVKIKKCKKAFITCTLTDRGEMLTVFIPVDCRFIKDSSFKSDEVIGIFFSLFLLFSVIF